MKIAKYFVLSLFGLLTAGMMSSCSDDPTDGDAPRLFRPVASLETSNNSVIATWDNIAGATQYTLELYRVKGTDEAGNNEYELYKTVTCESSPYTFSDLAWDEKYKVKISASGAKSSEAYETKDVTIAFPTTLKSVKTIDNAARVTWDNGKKDEEEATEPETPAEESCGGTCTCEGCGKGDACTCTNCTCPNCKAAEEPETPSEGGESEESSVTVIKAIVAVPVEGGESIVKIINSSTFEAGTVDILGLDPQTQYYFVAYTTNDEAEFNNSTYAGRLSGTTTKAQDFDALYGAGNYLDIREYDEKQAKDTLKTAEFWTQVNDGMTIILRGDFDYKVNNSIAFDKSVRFVTASTLGSNARFVSSGGLTMAKSVTVDWVEFVNVDFISDKTLNGDNPVASNTDKGWGGRQVFNVNGTNSTLKKLSFKGCNVTGYRAFVRAQAATDNILEINVDGCTLNCIGDQGVFTTTNKAADWQTINLRNSTITNIVLLCDLRLTAKPLTMNIENCTFCYAPIETKANANTPMFRFNGNDQQITLNVSNTLFGPAMATEKQDGGNIQTYTAGTSGSIFLNGNDGTEKPAPMVSVSKSFKTNFIWLDLGKDGAQKIYPLDGLQELSMDEKALWNNPTKGEFRIIANLPESGLGAPMWQ